MVWLNACIIGALNLFWCWYIVYQYRYMRRMALERNETP